MTEQTTNMEYAVTWYVIESTGGFYSEEREAAYRAYRRLTCYVSRLSNDESGSEFYSVGVLPSEFDAFKKAAHAADVRIYEDRRFEDYVW